MDSAACHRTDDEEGLDPRGHVVGQWGVGWFVRQIFFVGEEPHEGSALLVVRSDRAPEHRVRRLQRVQQRALGCRRADVELHLPRYVREHLQVGGQHDADHGNVCTSTDSTAGRSRTIDVQLSPASAEP